jgi:D-tagatose 6-phosphate 4-epimerase
MLQATADGAHVLIEATCNQVNHEGGYTGLTPAAFRDQLLAIAHDVGFPAARLWLGGDHLGPSPWRQLPADRAMAQAERMVEAYVSAGYRKIHLDTSMGCQAEPARMDNATTAARAARLAVVAESVARGQEDWPLYVIGTEVPAPGGAVHEIEEIEVTTPEAVMASFEAHREAFAAAGIKRAFERVIAMVAQPGVEFDHQSVVIYRPQSSRDLVGALSGLPGLVFEAHSTDYQPSASLQQLVRDGFAILKVGPALTFALREALYGLDHIAVALDPDWRGQSLIGVMEREMVERPGYWANYYPGSPNHQRALRHFSYSDRIRYYWASPPARDAVRRLFAFLRATGIPRPMLSQYFPRQYERVTGAAISPTPEILAIEAVRDVLRTYSQACGAARNAA